MNSTSEICRLRIWPGIAPGETDEISGHDAKTDNGDVTIRTGVTAPELFVYGFDDEVVRPAVMICPGGGYHVLAIDLEGSEIARWLNSVGLVAAVLHYRVPEKRDGALADAQRAMSLLRQRANEFGVDPARVGALGFSAGGHLTARLAVSGDHRCYPATDGIDSYSCGPNFAALVYPAYLIDSSTGAPPLEVAPHAGMSPMFLTQTEDDDHYCTEQYAQFVEAAGVQAANYVYSTGGHGYGLRASAEVPVSMWPYEAAKWLKRVVGQLEIVANTQVNQK